MNDDSMGPHPVTLSDQVVERETSIAVRTERAMLAFEERRQHGSRHVIGTPFGGLDSALRGGLWPGTYILTGAPGSGKTQLASQISATAAIAGCSTVHIVFGLSENEVMARLLSTLARPLVPWSDVLLGAVEGRRWERVEEAAARLREVPMHVEATQLLRFSPAAVEELCESVRRSTDRRMLIVLDGVPLTSSDEDLRRGAHRLLQGARYAAEQFGAALLLVVPSAHPSLSPKVSPSALDPAAYSDLLASLGEDAVASDGVMAIARRPGGPGASWLALPKISYAPPASVELYFSGSVFTESQK